VLRRHVRRRPGRHAGRRGQVHEPRDAEVDHPRAVRGEQHVAGLEVAVHDPGPVDGGERGDRGHGEPVQGRARPHALGPDHVLERRPVDVLADDVRRVVVEGDVEDGGGAELGDLPGRGDLPAQRR
jgi:hypothetical protein